MMTTVSAVISAVFILFIALGALLGMKRGWFRASTRLGVIILAVLLSSLITVLLAGALSGTVKGALEELLPTVMDEEVYYDLIAGSDILLDLVLAIALSLVAPFVFVVVFLIVWPLSGLFGLLFKSLDADRVITDKLHAGISMPLGALCGALGMFVILTALTLPIVGYLNVADEVVGAYSEAEGKRVEVWDEYIDPIADNFMLKAFHTVGGKLVFESVSAVDFKGNDLKLTGEIKNLASSYSDIKALSGGLSSFGKEQSEAVKNLIETINRSDFLPEVAADLLSAAAKQWSEGKEFMGVAAPKAEGAMAGMLSSLIESLKDCTPATLREDLTTFADLLSTLSEYDVFESLDTSDPSKLMDKISQEGFVSSLISGMAGNDRLNGVVTEVVNMALDVVADQFNIPKDTVDVYDKLMAETAASYNSTVAGEYSQDALASAISSVMSKYKVDCGEEVIPYIAEYMYKEFGNRTDVSAEEVTSFYVEAFGGILSEVEGAAVIENAAQSSAAAELREKLKSLSIEVEKIAVLSSFETKEELKTDMMTLEDLKVDATVLSGMSAEEIKKEAENIEKATTAIVKFTDSITNGEIKGVEDLDLSNLGAAFNAMKNSELLSGVTETMLRSVASSEMAESMPVIKEILSDEIIDELMKEETDIQNVLENTKDIIVIVGSMSSSSSKPSEPSNPENPGDPADPEKTPDQSGDESGSVQNPDNAEQMVQSVENLISNMSPASAKILKSMMSVKALTSYGMPEDLAIKASSLVGTLLDAMSDSSALTKEEYKKEADAIKHLFDIAKGSADNMGSGSVVFGEKLPTAKELLEIFVTSKVISKTVVSFVQAQGENPFGITGTWAKEDVDSFKAAADSLIAKNSAHKAAIDAIVALLAMPYGK